MQDVYVILFCDPDADALQAYKAAKRSHLGQAGNYRELSIYSPSRGPDSRAWIDCIASDREHF